MFLFFSAYRGCTPVDEKYSQLQVDIHCLREREGLLFFYRQRERSLPIELSFVPRHKTFLSIALGRYPSPCLATSPPLPGAQKRKEIFQIGS